MDGTTVVGVCPTDSKNDPRSGRRSDANRGRHGDVDLNGDLVDRLRGAVGDTVRPIDPDEHVRQVALEIMRAKAVAR